MVEISPRIAGRWPHSRREFSNWLITVRTDKVQMPDGSHADRTVVTHIGAVAILAS